MEDWFWFTDATVPDGLGFPLWGKEHILWLIAAGIFIAAMLTAFHLLGERGRRRILKAVCALLFLDEFLKYALTIRSGVFWWGCLPLHLCSINIFVILADCLRPREWCREILFAICMPASFFALLFPGWSYLPALSAMGIHHFTAHILLFLYPLLVLMDGFKPKFSRLLRLLPKFLWILIPIYFLNKLLDTNFFFLNSPGEGNPLSLLEKYLGNPGYLIGLPIIAGLCWLLLYGVPLVLRKIKERVRV